MKILVTYDGTIQSKKALKYGLEKAKDAGGEVIALYVFNSGMFIDYDATPGAESTARRESFRFIQEAKAIISEAGSSIKTTVIVEEGNPKEEIVKYARKEKVDVIFSTPKYKSIIKKAPCRVSIIPGHILFPVDSTNIPAAMFDKVVKEARATGSMVVLLGIVPVHIYGKWENDELERIKKETLLILNNAVKRLGEEGIEAKEIISSGYPDEEILKAAEEYSVSMIMIPDGGDIPSELNKAANIILDEPDMVKMPVLIVPKTEPA